MRKLSVLVIFPAVWLYGIMQNSLDRLDNQALTLEKNMGTGEYCLGEKSSLLHTFLKFCPVPYQVKFISSSNSLTFSAFSFSKNLSQ
jgi:hypothetical protein